MSKKILCVDDDPNILQGYKRALRKEFEISLAEGGEQGLALMAQEGPFAVIVSDMQMPGMDGAQFLARVKETAPTSVRIMLTGNSDQQTAIDAVNEGNIFRFLNKPCPPETLAQTLLAGLEQYRLVTAEKQLLEETLNNSLQVMVDILSLTNPTAFSRSARFKRWARDIATQLGAANIWQIEIAAMLSQIGCITVPEETLLKISRGASLTEKELHLYHQHPQVGHDLTARIPRLETVAQIIAAQNRRITDDPKANSPFDPTDTPTVGARILKVVLDFEKLLETGSLPFAALRDLAGRAGWYDTTVLTALKELIHKNDEELVPVKLFLSELKPGMVLDESLITKRGALLLSAGQEITLSLILRLINFAETDLIAGEVQVRVPVNSIQVEVAAR
ncbi:MAG: response regulator [Acidobacteria bacterium]|nr:response regulator [Acidobacteriota bacterium]